jgi:hypothetical protein
MVHTLSERETDALIARHIGPHPTNPGLYEFCSRTTAYPVDDPTATP